MPWTPTSPPERRPGELRRAHWWSMRKTPATTVHDVWIKATLAATHAAAQASQISSITTNLELLETRLRQLDAGLAQLSTGLAELRTDLATARKLPRQRKDNPT